MILRELPKNDDAECQLIGCCMIDGAKTVSMALESKISPDCFYEPVRGAIFALIVDMAARGGEINDATVLQEAMRKQSVDAMGGASAIFAYSSGTPTSANAKQLIAIVNELADVRAVIRVGMELVEKAYDYSGDGVLELIAKPMERLLSLATHSDGPEEDWPKTIDQADVMRAEIVANRGAPLAASVEFPWSEMNKFFGPMLRGQLVTIAARTSIGKSSLARPIACHVARQGKHVYFDTLEVQPVRVALQMAATLSRVGVRQLGIAHPREQEDFRKALLSLRNAGITMSRKDRSIAQIVGRIKALKAQGKIDLAVIDHGGLIEEIAMAHTGSEKTAAVGRVTKTLKLLAVDVDIPIILLWQLNRGSEKENNREPILSDLKDSGSVEEDSDKVIFIHRPSDNPLTGCEQPTSSRVEECPRFFQNVCQAKGRDEGTTFVSFYFDRQTASFTPIENTK